MSPVWDYSQRSYFPISAKLPTVWKQFGTWWYWSPAVITSTIPQMTVAEIQTEKEILNITCWNIKQILQTSENPLKLPLNVHALLFFFAANALGRQVGWQGVENESSTKIQLEDTSALVLLKDHMLVWHSHIHPLTQTHTFFHHASFQLVSGYSFWEDELAPKTTQPCITNRPCLYSRLLSEMVQEFQAFYYFLWERLEITLIISIPLEVFVKEKGNVFKYWNETWREKALEDLTGVRIIPMKEALVWFSAYLIMRIVLYALHCKCSALARSPASKLCRPEPAWEAPLCEFLACFHSLGITAWQWGFQSIHWTVKPATDLKWSSVFFCAWCTLRSFLSRSEFLQIIFIYPCVFYYNDKDRDWTYQNNREAQQCQRQSRIEIQK